MPRLEEVVYYLQGLWMLFTGKLEGFGWLDFSERGFWRSWWAIVYCLPPILLGWGAFRSAYLSSMPAGTRIDVDFFVALAVIELSTWVVPAIVVLVIARLTGLGRFAFPIIVATNWLSVPLQWIYSIENILQLMAPGNNAVFGLLLLAFIITSFFVHFRIISRIMGGDRLAASAIVMALFIGSYSAQYQLMSLFGLWLS